MDPDSNPLLNSLDHKPPSRHGKVVQPLDNDLKVETGKPNTGAPEAVSLIRDKLNKLYANEPNAKEEQAEAEAAGRHRSKHQRFMHELSASGKSLAEIQTAWHNYYLQLPNHEKHEVWQEFYSEHSRASQHPPSTRDPQIDKPHVTHRDLKKPVRKPDDQRTVSNIKTELLGRVTKKRARRGKSGHSILFGLAMGGVVSSFMLFGFFNERFIAPFITPSKSVSNTPIIIDPATTAVGPESKIIIPKINVEIPIIFDEPSVEEAAVQRALEEGVIHYATTSNPGETGNGAIFGHSSNNILNKGKYKFAFVLLKRLENGDVFYVQKDGKRYAYRVYKKHVVTPEQTEVLASQDKPATMSLITCDPPGTSINRLVVVGEQISPDPGQNVASQPKQAAPNPGVLPSNSPSLWSRFTSWLTT